MLNIQEKGIKPSNALPYHYHVNFEEGKIKMTNLKEKAVPLLVYDRTNFNHDNFCFSYPLYSKQELFHEINIGEYNYEVSGPNGFYRNFRGDHAPELKISLNTLSSVNEVELVFEKLNNTNNPVTVENLYEKSQRKITVQKNREKIPANLNKTKGWYDLRLTSGNLIWHFAGRIETGNPTISDPHVNESYYSLTVLSVRHLSG